jgi:hypothetical protein
MIQQIVPAELGTYSNELKGHIRSTTPAVPWCSGLLYEIITQNNYF